MIQLNKFYSLSRYYRKPSIVEQACVFENSHILNLFLALASSRQIKKDQKKK